MSRRKKIELDEESLGLGKLHGSMRIAKKEVKGVERRKQEKALR